MLVLRVPIMFLMLASATVSFFYLMVLHFCNNGMCVFQSILLRTV